MKSPFNKPFGSHSPFGSQSGSPLSISYSALSFNEDDQPYTVEGAELISFTDTEDTGFTEYEITLEISDGTITLSQTTGLTFSVGDGTADATMTFTGTSADINAALDGLIIDDAEDGAPTFDITIENQSTNDIAAVVIPVEVEASLGETLVLLYGQSLSIGQDVSAVAQMASAEATKTITGATQANPCVITSTAHGYSSNDEIYIQSVAGMTALNSTSFIVTYIDANSYSLKYIDGTNVNSTGFGAYTSGGTSARTLVSGTHRMLNGGVRAALDDRAISAAEVMVEEATQLTSLVPLRERKSKLNTGLFSETFAYGMGLHITAPAIFNAMGRAGMPVLDLSLSSTTSAGGGVMHGVLYFNNFIAGARQATTLLEAEAKSPSAEVFVVYKGLDADGASVTKANVKTHLAQLISDTTRGLTAVMKNAPTVHFIIDQQAWGQAALTSGEVTVGALEMFRSGELIMAGPTYWCDWFYGTNDPHFTPRGYRNYGEHLGRIVQQIKSTGSWKPCYINSQPTRVGTTITVPVWVPEGNLVSDTVTVTEPTANLKGFTWSGGGRAISSVSIGTTTANQCNITITLDGDPGTSGTLSYAYENYSTSGRNGPTIGPRGNIRDSSTFVTAYDSTPIYNWLCRDQWTVA